MAGPTAYLIHSTDTWETREDISKYTRMNNIANEEREQRRELEHVVANRMDLVNRFMNAGYKPQNGTPGGPDLIPQQPPHIGSFKALLELGMPPDIQIKDESSLLGMPGVHTNGQFPPQEPEVFKCTVCNKELASKPKLARHMKTHMETKPASKEHTCSLCGNTYAHRYNLKRHLKRCHKLTPEAINGLLDDKVETNDGFDNSSNSMNYEKDDDKSELFATYVGENGMFDDKANILDSHFNSNTFSSEFNNYSHLNPSHSFGNEFSMQSMANKTPQLPGMNLLNGAHEMSPFGFNPLLPPYKSTIGNGTGNATPKIGSSNNHTNSSSVSNITNVTTNITTNITTNNITSDIATLSKTTSNASKLVTDSQIGSNSNDIKINPSKNINDLKNQFNKMNENNINNINSTKMIDNSGTTSNMNIDNMNNAANILTSNMLHNPFNLNNEMNNGGEKNSNSNSNSNNNGNSLNNPTMNNNVSSAISSTSNVSKMPPRIPNLPKNEDKPKCHVCDKELSTKWSLMRHLAKVHKMDPKPNEATPPSLLKDRSDSSSKAIKTEPGLQTLDTKTSLLDTKTESKFLPGGKPGQFNHNDRLLGDLTKMEGSSPLSAQFPGNGMMQQRNNIDLSPFGFSGLTQEEIQYLTTGMGSAQDLLLNSGLGVGNIPFNPTLPNSANQFTKRADETTHQEHLKITHEPKSALSGGILLGLNSELESSSPKLTIVPPPSDAMTLDQDNYAKLTSGLYGPHAVQRISSTATKSSSLSFPASAGSEIDIKEEEPDTKESPEEKIFFDLSQSVISGSNDVKPTEVKMEEDKLGYSIVTYSDKLMYKCNMCNKELASKSGLNTHMKRHTGEDLNKCNACGKSFTHKCRLITHLMNAHTSEKGSNLSGAVNHEVDRSLLAPTGEPSAADNVPKCPVCGKEFPDKNSLRQHVDCFIRH